MQLADLNQELEAIWNAHRSESGSLAPLYFSKKNRSSLLCIGMNPSHDFEWFRIKFGWNKSRVQQIFSWSGNNCENRALQECADRGALQNHQYFARPKKLATFVGLELAHVDLFPVRKTQQKVVRKLVYAAGKKENAVFTEFAKKCIALLRKALQYYRPIAIVVINAEAGDVLRRSWTQEISAFDSRAGHHWLQIENEKIPLFFSGMLSGQRALDNGSFERLKWHVRRAVTQAQRRASRSGASQR